MAEKYDSTILIEKDGTAVNLEKLLAVMKLNIQYQETASETSQQRTQETGWHIAANRCKG